MRPVLAALVTLFFVGVQGPAGAQVLSVPAPAPTDNASDRGWFMERAPIYVDGDVFYPAGASVFFDRNTMVPSGRFDGVQLYIDTTLEPHSIVYVPIGRGLLQPYERRRQGELAGTVGSRTPSFPIQHDAEALATGAEYTPPGFQIEELPADLVVDPRLTPQPTSSLGVLGSGEEADEMSVIGSAGVAPVPLGPVRTAIPPESNAGVWIDWNGARWQLAGRAVLRASAALDQIGEYHGFPVYRSREYVNRIYVPSRDDLMVPYDRAMSLAPTSQP